MLQYFSYRLAASKPVFYVKAFELAVAAEARRLKEMHFKAFVDELSLLETEFPIEEARLSRFDGKEILREFDQASKHMLHLEDVRLERVDLEGRLDEYLKEVKMLNYNASYDCCAEAYDCAFAPSDDDFAAWWASACTQYCRLARGPCEGNFLLSCLQDLGQRAEGQVSQHSAQVKLLYQEIEELRRQGDDAEEEARAAKQLLEESLALHSSQSKAKEKRISDLQTNVSLRVIQAEERVRQLGRELQHTKLELEHVHMEKEAIVVRERKLHRQAVAEAEERGKHYQAELLKLERDFADYIRTADKSDAEPPMLESGEDTLVGDAALINVIKYYANELGNCFANVAQERSKNLKLLDQLAKTQTELHRCKVQQQTASMQAASWQERFELSKADQQNQLNRFASSLERHNSQLRDTLASVAQETSKKGAVIAGLQGQLVAAEQMKEEMRLEVELLQKQVETAYEGQGC
jgi:hypothetical protein